MLLIKLYIYVNRFLWIGGFPCDASFGEIWPTDVR